MNEKSRKKECPILVRGIVVFICALCVSIGYMSAAGIRYMLKSPDMYYFTDSSEDAVRIHMTGEVYSSAKTIAKMALGMDYNELCEDTYIKEYYEEYCNQNGIAFCLSGGENSYYIGDRDIDQAKAESYAFEIEYGQIPILHEDSWYDTLEIYVYKTLDMTSRLAVYGNIGRFIFSMRYAVFIIAALSVLIFIGLFIFLMYITGKKRESDVSKKYFMRYVPFGLLWGASAAAMIVMYLFFEWIVHYYTSDVIQQVIAPVYTSVVALVFVVLCMDLAMRIRLHIFWKSTLLYCAWRIIREIPYIIKTLLLIVLVGALTLCTLMLHRLSYQLICAFIGFCAVSAIVIYGAIMLNRLLKASKHLAEGDLEYKVSTAGMMLEIKNAADNLNSIGNGMAIAIEEKTKSERFRGELITNVSHDIKTPLTSIVNYIELLEMEGADSENAREYIGVISRQSEKLKRLIDDLLTASKASSGSMPVNLSACETDILLSQISAEFKDRFSGRNLELVCTTEPLRIMADGALICRVLDNIMGNAAKYSLPGTRVYLDCRRISNRAIITLKNTSEQRLSMSADELTERFVRGDSSRSSDGNGLGLYIAKSFTELMGGEFEIDVDGDLFKVILSFNVI